MRSVQHLNDWLETHWVTPAYAGLVLLGLTLFFLLAAANTLAGWLYVLSGLGLAILTIAALLPARSLQGLTLQRMPILPVSAGGTLKLGLTLHNPTGSERSLLQVQDQLPAQLGTPPQTAIDLIPATGTYTWTYDLETRDRGIYHWQTVYLRTAAPLGLFWCRRSHPAPAKAIIYPIVLTLTQCPWVDQIGTDEHSQMQPRSHHPQASPEGATRSLRPYRRGDPMRLIHWRTSARHNELRTRELELFTGGQPIIIALDSTGAWHRDHFEQAVIAAASLYLYASQHQNSVQLWTAGGGLCSGKTQVLETLAQVQPQATAQVPRPEGPIIWLSQTPSLNALPPGSRWLLWPSSSPPSPATQGLQSRASASPFTERQERRHPQAANPPLAQPATSRASKRSSSGIYIQPDLPLQPQLQNPEPQPSN